MTEPMEKVKALENGAAKVAQAAAAVVVAVDAAAPSCVASPGAVAAPCDARKPWQSKTVIAAAVTALLPFVPGVGPALSAYLGLHPDVLMPVLGALFAGLRLISNGKVTVK